MCVYYYLFFQFQVQNQGFLVDEESLKGIKLSDNRNLNDTSKNEVPHITVSISAEKDENGRNIAKAVNTWKCDFHLYILQIQ